MFFVHFIKHPLLIKHLTRSEALLWSHTSQFRSVSEEAWNFGERAKVIHKNSLLNIKLKLVLEFQLQQKWKWLSGLSKDKLQKSSFSSQMFRNTVRSQNQGFCRVLKSLKINNNKKKLKAFNVRRSINQGTRVRVRPVVDLHYPI